MEEEDWVWQLEDMEGVDLEAQRRELERIEQARHDRLMAEELQGDRREGERDFPAPHTVDVDEQPALLMTVDASPSPSLLVSSSPAPSEDAETQTRIPPSTSNTTAQQNIDSSVIPEQMAILSPSPATSRQCWEVVTSEVNFFTPTTSPSHSPPSHTTHITPSHSHNHPSPQSLLRSASSADYSYPRDTQTAGYPSMASPSCSSRFLESDQKLAQQLQEQEEREREREKGRLDKLCNLDHCLAMELMRTEMGGEEGGDSERGEGFFERVPKEAELQSQRDAEIARALQNELQTEQQGGGEGSSGFEEDIYLAQRLQNEDRERLQRSSCDEQLAYALQAEPSGEDTTGDEEIARQIASQFEPTSDTSVSANSSQNSEQWLLARPPKWWTPCPNCPAESSRKYHLIEINCGDNEWLSVTDPLSNAGFTVERLRRVQNMKLFRRLQFEKESMKMGREDGYQVNEKLLFHTSSAEESVICSEGLDQRLSRKGRFGSGVYFSDDPRKCDSYWRGSDTRIMFACCVLLGTIKEYPHKKTDATLLREPPGYDSVKGNVTGQDEYIIYSHYRAMPAYIVEYR